METKKFQRTKEDFVCEICGTRVAGTGYTNHCPQCLWSKHVDINPGVRGAHCRGLMEPVGAHKAGKGYNIVYRCRVCNKEIKNKALPEDNMDVIIKLSAQP